jgi:hypothetical protein
MGGLPSRFNTLSEVSGSVPPLSGRLRRARSGHPIIVNLPRCPPAFASMLARRVRGRLPFSGEPPSVQFSKLLKIMAAYDHLVIFLHGIGASGAQLMPLASSWRAQLYPVCKER